MGFTLHPRLVFLLLGLWVHPAAGQTEPDPVPEPETPTIPTRPVPLSYTKTVTPNTNKEAPTKKKSEDRLRALEVIVNGTKTGTWLLLERDGEMYAPYDAFQEWRVQLPPDAKPIDYTLNDQSYWPLSAVPGYKFKLDAPNQSAELLFSPQAFLATRVTQDKYKRPVVSPILPSLFLNYDLNYTTTFLRESPNVRDLGLLAEVGASVPWGVLTSSHVGRNLTVDAASGTPHSWVRLETTFTRDFPDDIHTLRLGDTVTREGMWGRNVYFGGIQYGSNFALSPGLVTQPIPALGGISTAPSTVEMYINDVLRQTSNVPAGPFAIDNYPLLTGSGDVRMVVRDLLGRETVIEQSFFITTELLSAGLNDWSIEAGRLRRDIGVASNHYGPGFLSGNWRQGYSNDLTLEGRVEATSQFRTIGLGTISTLPKQVLGKASLAASGGQGQNGGLWLLGLEHQRLRSSLSFQIQGASINFRQLGQPETTSPIKLQMAGNWSYTSETKGTFGVGLAAIDRFDNTKISTLSGNYTARIGANSNLNLTLSKAIYGSSGTSVGMYFVMPLGHNRIVSASANSHGGKQDYYVSANQNPSQEDHIGWRTLAGRQQDQSRAEGGVYYLGRYGRWSGDASYSPDQHAMRLGANGGIVFADKKLFATQQVDQSFAVAEVTGHENIGIGLGSNVLTHTDSDGVALIPHLMPYQNNPIRLDPSELPISAEIDSIEQNAVPAWRSAVKVVFPVRGGRGALLSFILKDGEYVPAGALVNIEGDKEEFYVARRGAAFVTGLESTDRVVVKWNGQQCKIDVVLPPESPDEIPRIGPLLCKGMPQ